MQYNLKLFSQRQGEVLFFCISSFRPFRRVHWEGFFSSSFIMSITGFTFKTY